MGISLGLETRSYIGVVDLSEVRKMVQYRSSELVLQKVVTVFPL